MTGYDFHPEAEADLDEIWGYIAADNVNAADRVMAHSQRALENLVPFPNQGHKWPDLTTRPVRFKWVSDHLIAYAPDEKPLWVIAVMHATAALAWWRLFFAAGRPPRKNLRKVSPTGWTHGKLGGRERRERPWNWRFFEMNLSNSKWDGVV